MKSTIAISSNESSIVIIKNNSAEETQTVSHIAAFRTLDHNSKSNY